MKRYYRLNMENTNGSAGQKLYDGLAYRTLKCVYVIRQAGPGGADRLIAAFRLDTRIPSVVIAEIVAGILGWPKDLMSLEMLKLSYKFEVKPDEPKFEVDSMGNPSPGSKTYRVTAERIGGGSGPITFAPWGERTGLDHPSPLVGRQHTRDTSRDVPVAGTLKSYKEYALRGDNEITTWRCVKCGSERRLRITQFGSRSAILNCVEKGCDGEVRCVERPRQFTRDEVIGILGREDAARWGFVSSPEGRTFKMKRCSVCGVTMFEAPSGSWVHP